MMQFCVVFFFNKNQSIIIVSVGYIQHVMQQKTAQFTALGWGWHYGYVIGVPRPNIGEAQKMAAFLPQELSFFSLSFFFLQLLVLGSSLALVIVSAITLTLATFKFYYLFYFF